MFWETIFDPANTVKLSITEHLRPLIALPIQLGGMLVTAPHLNTESEYNILRLLTGDMDHIISQNRI